jgi:hypothetical protein
LRWRSTGSKVTLMPQKLLDVLMLGRCSHEFSWPRRGADGEYYQVCLLCAAEYKYDWATMRRTERVEHAKPETGIRRSHGREKRPSWVPRARRLKLDAPVRYRINKSNTWHEGIIANISQTGVFFHGPQQLPLNALLEMVFEMPEEISGQKNRNVVCQGRVIRSSEALDHARSKGRKKERDKERDKDPSKDHENNNNEDQGADAQGSEASEGVLAASIVDYKFIR